MWNKNLLHPWIDHSALLWPYAFVICRKQEQTSMSRSCFSDKLQCANPAFCVHFLLDFHWLPNELPRITAGTCNRKPQKTVGSVFFSFCSSPLPTLVSQILTKKKYFVQNLAKECQSALIKRKIRCWRKMEIQPFLWPVLYFSPLTLWETSRCLLSVQSPSLHGEEVF